MKYRFVPPGRSFPDRDGSGDGLASLPRALLDRHGARVLHPSSVPVADGWPAPRSTVYRARTLLVPQSLQRGTFLDQVQAVLERVGMRLVPVPAPEAVAGDPELADVPMIAGLKPIRDGRPPVVVDAWIALTALRDAAGGKGAGDGKGGEGDKGDESGKGDDVRRDAAAADTPGLRYTDVRRITLEHVLV